MSIPSWAVQDAKVVCIFDEDSFMPTAAGISRRLSELGIYVPKKGVTYTIRGRTPCGLGIYLQGIVNPVNVTGAETGYVSSRFAPVVTEKTEAEDLAMIKGLIGIKTEERV